MGDFEEALANAETETRLYFTYGKDGYLDARIARFTNLEELQLRDVPPECELPEGLLALPKLRHVGLSGENDKLVVPALIGKLHLERLDVWDVRASELPPLPRLRALRLTVVEPRSEVAVLAERFSHLVELSVWGHHLERGELPLDIERFGKLESLELVSCGIATLPDAFAKLAALRSFEIRGCPMTVFPEVLTRMPKLEAVRIGCSIAGLPPSIAQMSGLRELALPHALNKGAMLSRFDETDKLKALPRALGECTNLEKLVLDCCGVCDLEPLRPMTKLRSLSVSWSAIETIEPLSAMTELEELSLEHADRLRDLSPLAPLAKLRVLNLDNTRPKSLDVLRQLPALKELHVEGCEAKRIDAIYELDVELHADDEVKERYAARAQLRTLPTIASIAEALSARDVATVEAACAQLATWGAAASTRGQNAIAGALGLKSTTALDESDEDDGDEDDDDDDEDDDDEDDDFDDDDDDGDDDDDNDGAVQAGGYIPALDRALDRYLAQLSAPVLAQLFGALFRETGDNFPAALRIANELVSRDDDAAQCTLVDGFIAANEYYDTGHREHGNTVHDHLIDHVLPLLRGPALAKLLAWCSHGHLDDEYGDSMHPLFVPALARARGADRDAVVARLDAYAARVAERSPERVEAFWASLPDASAPDLVAARARLDARLEDARRFAELGKRLEDATHAATTLAELAFVPDDKLGELQRHLWTTNDLALPADARRALLRTWQRLDASQGTADALAHFATRVSIDELRADLDALAAADRAALLRSAVLRGIDTDAPADALDMLRALATELDQLPRAAADSGEVQHLLFHGAEHWEQKKFTRGLQRLAALPAYTPKSTDDESPSSLASMVAHLAECSELETLQLLARHVHKLELEGTALERVLAQLVAVCMVSNDPEGLEAILPLVPAEVTWDILAFNLACKHARSSDRESMLRFTKRALELGKSPDQFLSDSDFEEFVDDPDFVALLDAHR